MSRDKDLEPFSESIDEVFTKLGLPNPVLMSSLVEEWDTLAGNPWVGRSRPLYLKGKVLVVEASAPSMVAFLRYGESGLVETLEGRFGDGIIDSVEVVQPGGG
ncbi:MAG: DUF721 domain-containing protein [Acidimicrobiia bacterium]